MKWLRALFAPRGNLLTADILAEVTMHVMSDLSSKTSLSKFPDNAHGQVAQAIIQGLIHEAIRLAKERHISLNWPGIAAMHPPYPDHLEQLKGVDNA